MPAPMPRTVPVLQDGEITDVEVPDDLYDDYERFLDPGEAEGEEGFARIYPLIDEGGPEWTILTFRQGDDEPLTTTLHEYPTGVTECRIQHITAKRLFDKAEKIMNEFEFMDEDAKQAIEQVLWGDA